MKKLWYILSCFGLYGIVGLIASLTYFCLDDTQAMWQALGLGLVLNFFATAYIRNFLMYLFNINENNYLVANIFNCIYTIFSSIILYLLLNSKGLNNDLVAEISIIYGIFSYIVIMIENKMNGESEIFSILCKKNEKLAQKCKCVMLPLLFLLLWGIPVLIVTTILIRKLLSGTITSESIALEIYCVIYFAPHFYALLIGFIYSKVNFRISLKASDKDTIGNSSIGRVNYEMFLYLFILIYLLMIIFINSKLLTSKEQILGQSFLIVMIPYLLIRWLSFDGFIGYSNGKINSPKSKRIRATTINYSNTYSETTYRYDDGSVTRVDHFKF